MNRCFCSWLGVVTCLVSATVLTFGAQNEDEGTRSMWNDSYLAKADQATTKSTEKPVYQVKSSIRPIRVKERGVVGVTIWRLRMASGDVNGARPRLLVMKDGQKTEWLPERIEADNMLSKGDLVRISIEVGRSGYLYVIDRERYADGTTSEPYLIFPDKRVRDGQNLVKKAALVEVPGQDAPQSYFNLDPIDPSRTVAEELTILLSPTCIDGLEPSNGPVRLKKDQMARWEQRWGGRMGRMELVGGAGKPWTQREQEVGANPEILMKRGDPLPQTLFFKPSDQDDEPLMVRVNLTYVKPTEK